GLLLLDDQGRIELSNRAAWELLGEGADSLVGTQLKDLPIRWQDDPEALLKRSRSIGVCSAECSVAAPGAERQLEATVFRVEEKFGVLFQDETERIKAQQALTEALQSSVDFQRLFDGIPEGALLLREDFTVRRCNQAWRDLSGWPEGLDRPFPEAFHESDRNQVRQALEECLRSATGQASVEARLRSPEGVLRWVVVVAAACREDSALLVCLHDVSAMRQDIQRLQRSLEHLERMGRAFDALPTYFAVADAGGRILLVNEALGRAVHDDPIEAIGGHLADLVAEGDRPAWREAIASVERTGATLRGFLARMETANGPTAWVSWQASFDADRGLLYASGTEVTLLAESRDRIAREAAELTEFFSGIREAVVVTDPKGLIRFWSQSAERVFGFGAKNALGRRIADLLATPEDAERLEVNFELSKACGQMDLTATCRTATGRTVEIEGNIRWRSAEAPNPMAIWVLRDVTAEVEERSRLSAAGSRLTQAEEALRESSNSIWSWSAQEPYEAEWCLGDCRALTGREAPCSLRSLVSGLDRDWLFERLSQCLAEEKPLLDATFRVKGAGELKWVRARFLLPGHHGQRSIRCVLGEITEWKRIEESVREQNRELERLRTLLEERNTILAQQTERLGASLRESESARRKFEAAAQRYRRFVDGLPVACVVCDAEGKVVEWNQSAERVFERRPHEAIGKELVRLLAQNPLEAHDWDDLVRRTLRGESWPAVERPFRKPSGSAGWVLVGAIGLTDLDGASSGALFACYDITSRKEEEAHREERILQVHELAAKLAETQAELDRLRGLLDDQRSDAA
ncbi:MAG: PAS domain S-box protein, partial [Fimbriimonadales bacterium]|nr:PAS domain S-box protein [Fimbriimonadales bacterium]